MLILHFRKKKYSLFKLFILLLLCIYIAMVIGVTLTPFPLKEKILKFVTVDSGEKDLVHEMNKQLDILFKDQKKSKKTNDYNRMMSAIDENIRKVRNVGNKGETAGKQYILRREYEYEYYKILRKYLPSLLEQEQFFSNVFRD